MQVGWNQGRWDTLAVASTPMRRGAIKLAVPARGSYDQLRLVASEPRLDILSVELTYARGRTEVVRPARDGMVAIELGRGKLKSITVRYANLGAGRDAKIRVLAKDDARGNGRPGPGRGR
jgi:hypothetical protein